MLTMTTIQDNAYVSGLKDDLGFEGNQLVELQTMYTVGAVVGQLPFMFLFTYVPMNWTIPLLDICWGIFTLLQYRATSFAEMAAYRFLVGWFEVCFLIPPPVGCHHKLIMTTGSFLSGNALYFWCLVSW
jgi:hypothetical protein